MILAAEQVAVPGGGQDSTATDLRSRRLKSVIFPDSWLTSDAYLRTAPPDGDRIVTVAADGPERVITGSVPSTCWVMDPNDVKGLTWLALHASNPVGIPAGFAVIPNTADFSSGDPVTFTVTVWDGNEITTGAVTLDADYADVDGLVTELTSQIPNITWSNNAGALTAEFVSTRLGSYVDVTEIVDADDKINFSSIIDFAFPGYATDAYVTLITESRT